MTPAGSGGSPAGPQTARNPLVWLLIGPVVLYRKVISPWLPRTCRYYPSCSMYAVGALRRHGLFKGFALGSWRVLRCNPWSLGGVDMVPERGRWQPEPYQRPRDEGEDGAKAAGEPGQGTSSTASTT